MPMKNSLEFKYDWDFLTPDQTKDAQYELDQYFIRISEKKEITKPQAMEQWCKEHNINYKTLASWFKWKSNDKCPMKQKQLKRIELAFAKTINRVTLTSLWALMNVTNKHTEKNVADLMDTFLKADGLLIEFLWPRHKINTVGKNLQDADKSLKFFWEKVKKFKEITSKSISDETSINILQANMQLGEAADIFLNDMRNYKITPHINFVSSIFNKKFSDKKILMICLSAIQDRPDVKPDDLILDILMIPESAKIIT